MQASDGEEIGAWPLEEVHITGLHDGFAFRIEGTPGWVGTDNDGAFASEIGLRWAPSMWHDREHVSESNC